MRKKFSLLSFLAGLFFAGILFKMWVRINNIDDTWSEPWEKSAEPLNDYLMNEEIN